MSVLLAVVICSGGHIELLGRSRQRFLAHFAEQGHDARRVLGVVQHQQRLTRDDELEGLFGIADATEPEKAERLVRVDGVGKLARLNRAEL